MPTPSSLDFDALLQPISGDSPAGAATPFTLKQELEDARKEENPDDYDAADPRRPEQAKLADWGQIIRKTTDGLTNVSKDLMLAARLTEGLTRTQGFAGLRDGLHLLNRMLNECWDRCHPSIEDGDLEVRATPFNWLDDPDRGARFPTTVRMAPIVRGPDGAYSAFQWRQMQEGKGDLKKEDFERAVQNVTREDCQQTADDLKQAADELDAVQKSLDARLGQSGPGFSSLRPALMECQNLVNMMLQRKGPSPGETAAAEAAAESAAGEKGEAGQSKVQTRDSLYQQLQIIAGQLQQMEPHSPIPYLIQKAIELGHMPFPALMKALIRDDGVLTQMNRELGIREESS